MSSRYYISKRLRSDWENIEKIGYFRRLKDAADAWAKLVAADVEQKFIFRVARLNDRLGN